MTAAELLAECDARGIRLQALPADRLDVDAPAGNLTAEFVARLREHKAELLRLLADGSGGPGDPVAPRDAAPVIDPTGSAAAPAADRDAPICPACGSARIAQGQRWRWCIDCETRIGPPADRQDLTEADAIDSPERISGALVADPQDGGAAGSDDDHGGAPVAWQDLAAVRPSPAAPVPIPWPAAPTGFCLLLAPDELPPVPFRLNAWTTIQDTERFLRSLRADIERGPRGPRAFYGALQAELIELQQFALRWAEKGSA